MWVRRKKKLKLSHKLIIQKNITSNFGVPIRVSFSQSLYYSECVCLCHMHTDPRRTKLENYIHTDYRENVSSFCFNWSDHLLKTSHAACWNKTHILFIYLFFNFYFYFISLYNTVLVLPYIDMNPLWVYMSQCFSWCTLHIS